MHKEMLNSINHEILQVAESEHRKQESLAHIDGLTVGVALIATTGRILYANTKALRIITEKSGASVHNTDVNQINFTAPWTAVKNVLPGLKMARDNHLTICYINQYRGLGEFVVCLAGLDVGPERHLILLGKGDTDAQQAAVRNERELLINFAQECSQLPGVIKQSPGSETVRQLLGG